MKLFDKWKEEWFKRERNKLEASFITDLRKVENDFYKVIEDVKEKQKAKLFEIEASDRELKLKLIEIQNLDKQLVERKLKLQEEDNHLREQIRLLEAKASPSNVWVEAFTAGFNKAWDMMWLQHQGIDQIKKSIEDKAISDTLGRLNGNHKKTN